VIIHERTWDKNFLRLISGNLIKHLGMWPIPEDWSMSMTVDTGEIKLLVCGFWLAWMGSNYGKLLKRHKWWQIMGVWKLSRLYQNKNPHLNPPQKTVPNEQYKNDAIFFDYWGTVHHNYVPQGRSINNTRYWCSGFLKMHAISSYFTDKILNNISAMNSTFGKHSSELSGTS
jgi:hypothetical protein